MNSIKKNLFYNSLYQLLVVLTPLITSPYVSRVLGAEGVGIYSYSNTIANYFMIFAMLGVSNYGNRSIARVRDDEEQRSKTFWSIYLFQLLFSSLIIILYMIYILFICKENIDIAIIQCLLVISAAIDINWFFFGMELFRITAIRSIIIKILTVISILLFVNESKDVWIYSLIMAITVLLNQFMVWPFLNKYVHKVKLTRKEIFVHFKPNLILFIPVIAISLYKYMDKIMIGNMSSMEQLGYYENAEKIINIPMSLITAIGTVMLPRISNLVSKGDNDSIKKINKNSIIVVTCISFVFVFGILGVSEYFIPIFFGEKFKPVIKLLYALTPTMVFISWANIIRTQYLLPNSKDMSYIISVFVGAVVNLLINILLIKEFGAWGASIGTFFAELSVTLVQIITVWKDMELKKCIKSIVPFFIFSFLMYLLIIDIYIVNDIMTIVIRICFGGVIYIGLSLIYILLLKKVKNKIFIEI